VHQVLEIKFASAFIFNKIVKTVAMIAKPFFLNIKIYITILISCILVAIKNTDLNGI
jgi:hypothetical protein